MSGPPVYWRGGRGRGRGQKKQQAHSVKPTNTTSVGWGQLGTGPEPVNYSAEKKFQDASEKHKESVQRHLEANNDNHFSSSEDEEDSQDSGTILRNLLQSFSGASGDASELGRTHNYLQNSFKTESSVCLICIETVKRNEAIWSCVGCYCMFHIPCIQKWVKDGVYQHSNLSEENFPKREIPWLCPKCRYEYKQSECPSQYHCFCSKVRDPKFDPWLVPHSCGQVCGRLLKPDCGHDCLLLCHPGPCPPCPKTVQAKCYCGKSSPQARRCGMKEWSCGQPCGGRLSCGQHRCADPCHPGDCSPCPKTSTQRCLCGKEKSIRSCASPQWQCQQECCRVLSCGQHTCEVTCHSGECAPCPRSGDRTCPCGKSVVQLPCTEDVPCCGDTCGKLLECGLHECTQRCHVGPCGMCRQMSRKKCRCGLKVKEVPCCKEFLCEVKCHETKNCGKHQCKRKCCDGNCPTCELQCGKTLGCRNHKCNNVCHTGQCYPCPLMVNLSCNCKSTTLTIPCGRERVTKPPRCGEPCKNPPDCHHSQRIKHRCHFGVCPPCRQVCQRVLGCSHSCPSVCHVAVRTKIQQKVVRAGPWEPMPETKIELVTYPCPPCKVPTPVRCLGGHEVSEIPCHNAKPFSCNRPCGRRLACGNHTCEADCHLVTGSTNDKMAGDNCSVCEAPCDKPRPDGCSHICTLPCHPGACPPCKQMIRMRCHCQMTVEHIECHKWTLADKGAKNRLKSCPGKCPKSLSCGHQCTMSCHAGECPNAALCKKKSIQKCACKRKKVEVACCDVQKGLTKVQCDDVCKELKDKEKQKEQQAEAERLELEKLKQQAELEEYERKIQGRKRKPRKRQETVQEVSTFDKYKNYLVFSVGVLVLAVFVYYIL